MSSLGSSLLKGTYTRISILFYDFVLILLFSQGYYRRAEALRKMLESDDWKSRVPGGTSFSNVASDYFQCHRKTENSNIKALYQAIVVATNHS